MFLSIDRIRNVTEDSTGTWKKIFWSSLFTNKKSKLVGDVNYNKVINIVGKITPVPGGVGPMTIACLMHNTLKAAFLNKKDNFIDIIEGIS